MITRINIKEQKLRANPIQFFISIIKLLKALLRGKKRYKGMIRIKSVVLQASKVIDFQFHLLVIPSLGQSPFTPPLQSCSSLKTSSMVFTKRNLSIKKQNILIWIWAKFLYPNYFSSGTTSNSILPLCFIFCQSISMLLTVSKTKNNIGRKSPSKKKKKYIYIYIGRKDYINTYERERERYVYLFWV